MASRCPDDSHPQSLREFTSLLCTDILGTYFLSFTCLPEVGCPLQMLGSSAFLQRPIIERFSCHQTNMVLAHQSPCDTFIDPQLLSFLQHRTITRTQLRSKPRRFTHRQVRIEVIATISIIRVLWHQSIIY